MVRMALDLPNMAEPDDLVSLGVAADRAGWDGVFLWDHVFGGPAFPVPMADPWVVLGGLATATERVRLGTAVTPVARRRPQKLARETVTVDRLSGGRMTLGVGLGSPDDEFTAFGEPGGADQRVRAARLDEGVDVLSRLWSGEEVRHRGAHHRADGALFVPPPVQQPRIPVWAACTVPHTAPLARAARWDGVILAALTPKGGIDPVTVDQVTDACGRIADHRRQAAVPDDLVGIDDGFDVAVVHPGLPDAATRAAYDGAGVTWVLVTGWLEDLRPLAAELPA
jgi:alkanesulfonate monooxygenase SsuD/methylene tetrahydromethanopterin reductase-like flavin-dependent oxidoreductase (luciferase family)